MGTVTIRELRNRGGTVIDRVEHGEQITITRDGKPVAQLHALDAPALSAQELLGRWRRLPPVDPDALRRDLDEFVDAAL
ncbi:MAG TPA: type II toxin-antitoxin system prevent-host-death family antitoxin [Conexibacter sp.]|nr:type II toxin-antitoxin system prevent-host-death family antitoxin [Conexibacter sp.]